MGRSGKARVARALDEAKERTTFCTNSSWIPSLGCQGGWATLRVISAGFQARQLPFGARALGPGRTRSAVKNLAESWARQKKTGQTSPDPPLQTLLQPWNPPPAVESSAPPPSTPRRESRRPTLFHRTFGGTAALWSGPQRGLAPRGISKVGEPLGATRGIRYIACHHP